MPKELKNILVLYVETSKSLDVIRHSTSWLDDSIQNHRGNNMKLLIDNSSQLPRCERWNADLDKQKE